MNSAHGILLAVIKFDQILYSLFKFRWRGGNWNLWTVGININELHCMLVNAAPPQRILSGFLHSFIESSRTNAPFPAVRLPELGLSQGDKLRIRDRSSIMGRHLFAEKGEAFVDSQVCVYL